MATYWNNVTSLEDIQRARRLNRILKTDSRATRTADAATCCTGAGKTPRQAARTAPYHYRRGRPGLRHLRRDQAAHCRTRRTSAAFFTSASFQPISSAGQQEDMGICM